jgi:peroxiredoxin family protein
MGIPNAVAGLPGMTDLATTMMKREIKKLDFPEIDEFIEMVHDAGAKLYGCKMSMDMMHLTRNDLCAEVDDVVGAMEFMEMSDGAQVLFI